MEEEEHDDRELEGETHKEGGGEAVPAEHKVDDEEEGEHPAREGGEDEAVAREEIGVKDEGQHVAASPEETQPKSEATKIESEGGLESGPQEHEDVEEVQDHEGGGGDNGDDEDEAATFDPEEGYEREKSLRNQSRANSDADARAEGQPGGGEEVVAIAEPDPSPATASTLDRVPQAAPAPEPEPLAEPSEAAPTPEHDEHHAVIPDVVVHDFGQPAEHHQHREHKEEEDKAAVAAAAGAAVGVVAAAATVGAADASSPSAKPVDNDSCAGTAAAGAAASATAKKKGLSGLLSFAYSPRSFSAGSVAATAAGGGGPSPRRELSSSAPHPPLLSSPRMMVLPSPPPPLHLPKPTPPLGSTVGHDQEPQVVLVQKCWRRRVARRKIHELVMHSRARFKVAEEIAATEKNYVDILHTIIEVFMEPLAKQLPGWIAEQNKAKKVKGAPEPLDPALVEIMFGNVKELYKMHKPFAEALQHAIKNWYPYRRMGVLFMDVLLRQNGFLVEYGKYVNGYGAAIKHWNQAMRHPAFARFINTALDNPRCAHLDFCSLIINPVQRVPRYALLLRDIQKHTWAGHGDEESVAHALDKIHIVAEYVNEAKRAAEGMERTTYLQDHIDDKKLAASLSQPQRKYIREGPLKLVHRSDFKDRHVVLFNDIVVITVSKPTGKTSPRLPPSALPTDLCVKGTIELKHSVEAKALDKPERGLQLTVHGKTTKWQAATAKDRDEWLRDLQSLTSRP